MEIKSRVTRFAGLLCIAGALQGFPVIYSANPGGIISVARQGTYHLTATIDVSYTHLRPHETRSNLECRLLL